MVFLLQCPLNELTTCFKNSFPVLMAFAVYLAASNIGYCITNSKVTSLLQMC